MCWAIGVALFALLVFLVWASADVGSNVYLRTLCRSQTDEKVLALTFDDGPDEEMTPKVLDVLATYGIKAAFFLVGCRVEANPKLVRRMVDEGHTVGNHTYSHSGFSPLKSCSAVEREISRCGEAIETAVGKRPRLFRPPFGVTNPPIARAVRRLKLQSIGWSVRSLDTITSRNRRKICNFVLKNLHPGAVVLLHDGCEDSDVLLDLLIREVLSRGYSFVPLVELLNVEAYEN